MSHICPFDKRRGEYRLGFSRAVMGPCARLKRRNQVSSPVPDKSNFDSDSIGFHLLVTWGGGTVGQFRWSANPIKFIYIFFFL